MDIQKLNHFLYNELPLARALQIEVQRADRSSVLLRAPFAPNRNAHGSAFGGSLAALGILGGWATVYSRLHLDGIDAALVIKTSHCDYQAPITSDICVEAAISDAQWTDFLAYFQSHGKARISVDSRLVGEDGKQGALHTGTYVAMRPDKH